MLNALDQHISIGLYVAQQSPLNTAVIRIMAFKPLKRVFEFGQNGWIFQQSCQYHCFAQMPLGGPFRTHQKA